MEQMLFRLTYQIKQYFEDREEEMSEMLDYQDVVIVDGARTPIGRFGGSLRGLPVWQLGALAIKGIMARTGIDPELIGEVVMSHTRQDGTGTNPARNMMLFAGVPLKVPAHTVNMVCAAGLKALHLAVQSIRLRETEIAIAGGSESMSNIPHVLKNARWNGFRLQNITVEDGFLALSDNYSHLTPGQTAERCSEKHGLTKEENDIIGYESHLKASKAWEAGVYDDEVFAVDIPPATKKEKGFTLYSDECYRKNPDLERMKKLRPAFQKDGTVTAGSSSGITDGSGASLIMTRKKAEELGYKPIASFVDFLFYGLEPADFPDGPGLSIPVILKRNNMKIDDMRYVEINEAFSSVILAAEKMLNWKDREKMNAHGGCIAMGHPTGYSGQRLTLHLGHSLKKEEYGLACLCGGGGIAGNVILKGEKEEGQEFKKVIIGLDDKGFAVSRDPSPEELEKIKNHEPSDVFKSIN